MGTFAHFLYIQCHVYIHPACYVIQKNWNVLNYLMHPHPPTCLAIIKFNIIIYTGIIVCSEEKPLDNIN